MKLKDKKGQPVFINKIDKYFYETQPWYHVNREEILLGLRQIIQEMVKEALEK